MAAVVFLLGAGIPAFCTAQDNETASLTIRTYYPAPYGIYKYVRIVPDLPVTPCVPGTMSVFQDGKVYMCNGAGTWGLAGGGDDGWAMNGTNMYMTVKGNLSIGTNSPSRKLEVNGTAFATVNACIPGKCLSQLVIPDINGMCGTAHGQDPNTPPTANLCGAGKPTTLSGSGPWTWQCTGIGKGTTASCGTVTWIGKCGSAAGKSDRMIPTANLCSSGLPRDMRVRESDFKWRWTCGGPPSVVSCESSHELIYCGVPNQWGSTHCKADCLARGGKLTYEPTSTTSHWLYCTGLISSCTGSWECCAPYHYDCNSIQWGTFGYLECQINATPTTVCSNEDQLYGPHHYACY